MFDDKFVFDIWIGIYKKNNGEGLYQEHINTYKEEQKLKGETSILRKALNKIGLISKDFLVWKK